MSTIALCLPHRKRSDYEWHESMARLQRGLEDAGHTVLQFRLQDCSLIEHARSWVATAAYDSGADVLFWADDDVEFGSEAMLLIEGALETKSLVAAPVTVRGGSALNVAFVDNIRVKFIKHGKRREVTGIGLALAAVHRQVFERIEASMPARPKALGGEPCVPFFKSFIADGYWFGEDKAFCLRAMATGSKLWCDTRVRTKHHNVVGLGLEDGIFGRHGEVEDLETSLHGEALAFDEWREEMNP